MRELHLNEMEMVAAAGIVTDDPNVQQAVNDFDELCKELKDAITDGSGGKMLENSVVISNKVVHGVVDIMDTALTHALNNIMKLFG